MNDFIKYTGRWIGCKQLFSMSFIIPMLEEEGPCFATLEKVRNRYLREFGNELCWNYPFCNGNHNGGVILPVEEGFLWLPYDAVDSETYEQFSLEDAHLLTAGEAKTLIKELTAYTGELCAALKDMRTELSLIQYQDEDGTIYCIQQDMDRDTFRASRRFMSTTYRREEGIPGMKYTSREQAQYELDEYAKKHGLQPVADNGGEDSGRL